MKIIQKQPMWLKEKPFRLDNPFDGYTPAVYDIEVYPNYFLAIFIGQKNKPIEYEIENIQDMIKDLSKKKLYLIGFNNHGYDDIIMKYIFMKHGNISTSEIYNLSCELIEGDNNQRSQRYWDIWWYQPPWGFSMDVFCIPKKEVGLKERAAKRHWYKIQDLPIEPGKELTEEDKKQIVPYCVNDVRITIEEWNDVQELVDIRKELKEIYPTANVISKHNAAVCEEIITTEYCKETGFTKKFVNSQRSLPGKHIDIENCIPEWVSFDSVVLSGLRRAWGMLSGRFTSDEDKSILTQTIDCCSLNFKVGAGGVHSNDEPLMLESNDDFSIIDIDVGSYYPNLMKSLKLTPGHMTAVFNSILENMTDNRLKAKKADEVTKSEGLKIVINSAYGKTGSKYSIMFDEEIQIRVTVAGQLALLMLMEKLYNESIIILSMNTDGIICFVARDSQLPKLREIYKDWESITNCKLEEVHYTKYVRRDVNNYLAIEDNGKTKEKGIFKRHIRGKASIIAQALRNHYVNNVSIEDTILNEIDLRQFIFYTHMSRGWKLLHKRYGQTMTPVQNTSRWYVSRGVMTDGTKYSPTEDVGDIVKCGNMTEKEKDRYMKTHETIEHPEDWKKFISVPHGKNSILINDLPRKFPSDLNHQYYIDQCHEIIKSIENETGKKVH